MDPDEEIARDVQAHSNESRWLVGQEETQHPNLKVKAFYLYARQKDVPLEHTWEQAKGDG